LCLLYVDDIAFDSDHSEDIHVNNVPIFYRTRRAWLGTWEIRMQDVCGKDFRASGNFEKKRWFLFWG